MARTTSGVRHAYQAFCKCGWCGSTYVGKGSAREAWTEYHMHKDKCPEWQVAIKTKGTTT